LASLDNWQMWVEGVRWTLEQFMSLDHRDMTFDIHCVTSWTRFESTFTGVPLAEVADPPANAAFVTFGSHSHRDHHTSLPVSYAMENSWIVHSFDGEPLSASHGGPVRVVTPGKYFYKSIKWLKSIDFLVEDRLGWWEVNSSYHNNADPFVGDQRFTTGSLRPEQLDRFMKAVSYDKYRGRVLLGLDLREWTPATAALSRLYLKNCDLSGVDLSGADLRAANLSLSMLRGSDLSGADLSGSDLEGADFGNANLTGADLSHTALSATRFEGSAVEGARFDGSWGLVESQRNYLVGRGVDI
jgi:hypothetical protein